MNEVTSVKVIFRSFYTESGIKSAPVWQQNFHIGNAQLILDVYSHWENELCQLQSVQKISALGEAFSQDLGELACNYNESILLFQYIKFWAASTLAKYFQTRKASPLTREWLDRALDESMPGASHYPNELERLMSIMAYRHPVIQQTGLIAMGAWLATACYYGWMVEPQYPPLIRFAEFFHDGFINAVTDLAITGSHYNNVQFNDDHLKAIGHMLAWADKTGRTDIGESAAGNLVRLYNLDGFQRIWKRDICEFLAAREVESGGHSFRYWAKLLLTEFTEDLKAQQRFFAWLNYTRYDNELLISNLSNVIKAIREYRAFFDEVNRRHELINYEISAIYHSSFPMLVNLMIGGFVEEAETLFAAFFEIEEYNSIAQQGIVHIITKSESVAYIFWRDEGLANIGWEMEENYTEVIRAKRAFLGLDDSNPNRRGIPRETEGNLYAEALRSHFAIDNWPAEMLLKPGYMLHVHGNHPLQAIVAKETERCIPLVTSFKIPKKQRPLRQVLLWHDNLPVSITELRGVKQILSGQNVHFTELNAGDHSLQDFIDAYETQHFDLVHISSHGQFDYEQPHRSEIILGNEIKLSLTKIKALEQKWEDRRLLFLNICDGATTSLQNSPASIGFSPTLVHPGQSLFSHLWPVVPSVAMLYAWLVAALLIQGLTYEEVYVETILLMHRGKESIIEFLSDYLDEELIEHIENLSINIKDFTHAGSLVFMV